MSAARESPDGKSRLAAGLFGAILALALLKFGNPPIFESMVTPPENIFEFFLASPWPISWGYGLLILVALVMVPTFSRPIGVPAWLIMLPGIWLGWQFLASLATVDSALTIPTLKHFCACAACFYLGLFSLSRLDSLRPLWICLVPAFCFMLVVGLEQHFGGLAETQRYFYLYIYPTLKHVPADYLKKMSSDRIFATQFYPNALAGCLLLLLPAVVSAVWRAERLMTAGARAFLAGAIGLAALACLYWSRSKGGWLLMLLEGLVVLWWLPENAGLLRKVRRRARWIATAILLTAGIAGFVGKYAGFFKKGATSVTARTDYWRAGVQTALSKPLFGTGPGTFSIPYAQLKRPEAEMTRLQHNDFLEQASDSGLPGFIAYSIFIVGGLFWTGRLIWGKAPESPAARSQGSNQVPAGYESFAVWVGLLIWNCQGLIEFGLYLPSMAWPAFALMGWLVGRSGNSVDTKPGSGYPER